MATPCFYHPELNLDSKLITLSSSEANHAAKSRRLAVGQDVKLLNGRGLIASGHITEIENRVVRLQADIVTSHARKVEFSIATAIPKRDRQKVMIDMLTQLGVSEIIPLACEHSVTRFKPNMHDKWSRVAIEACKQSQNPWLPEIDEEILTVDLVKVASKRLVFADANGAAIKDLAHKTNNLIVMIGPEGGFSPAERTLFYDNGIKSVTLGCHILRTETAAVTAAAQCL